MTLTPPKTTAVELRGLSKRFGSVVANADISLRAFSGSVHAIVGENGAGKSTAMKLLYGIYRPDSGEILIDGKSRRWRSPSDAIAAGVGMVHQHFMLGGPYTALENILLGAEPFSPGLASIPRAFRPMDRNRALGKLEELARQYALPVDWQAPVESLPVGIQQRVEILKLLYRDAKILIFDEPTAVLTPGETQGLFANFRKMAQEGKTILIITHKLKEVMAIADRVTVFRSGKVVGDREIDDTSVEDLATLMVGRKVALHADAPLPRAVAGVALEVRDLTIPSGEKSGRENSKHRLGGVSFSVAGGEIVGIAGVEGNGQSELLQALLHFRELCSGNPGVSGRIRVLGRNAEELTTDELRAAGAGVIPEDRHREGLLLERPIRENFLLGLQRRLPFYMNGFVSRLALNAALQRALKEFDVRPRMPSLEAGRMSGGNQQKLIIAREFHFSPKLLIAAQPTRGVDVGAIEFIHARIIEARNAGTAVLLVSSDLDEVLSLSDRVLVMYEGRIVDEFARGEASEEKLGVRMGGMTEGVR